MRKDAPAKFCSRFQKYTGFKGWTALVENISSYDGPNSSSSYADIEFDIGNKVTIQARIPINSEAYQEVASLREGEAVVFSGNFDHSIDLSACTYYAGPFDIILSSVKPL